MVEKDLNGTISKKPTNKQLSKTLHLKQIEKHMDTYALHHALEEIWAFIKEVNKYINDTEPWKADNKEEILYNVLDSTRIIAILLQPFLPETSEAMFSQLNVKPQTLKDAQFGLYKGGKINKGKHLFSKI